MRTNSITFVQTFGSLKKLRLVNSEFRDAHERPELDHDLTKKLFLSLLRSCPVLEELWIEECTVLPVIMVNASCLYLKQLIIHFCTTYAVKIAHAPNLEIVNFASLSSSMLSLPSLKHLKLDSIGKLSLDEISKNAPNLETLDLTFGWVRLDEDNCSSPFQNLKYITVNATEPEICSLLWIGRILRAAPFVKKFELIIDYTGLTDFVEMLEQPPDFYHNHLKELEIMGFDGDEVELDVISFVMSRAKALEKISLTCIPHGIEGPIEEKIEAVKFRRDAINSTVQILIM